MPAESSRTAVALSAAAGGLFYGFYHLALLYLSGRPITRRDVQRGLVNLACASASGALVAYFLGPALTAFVPWAALRDPVAVGFSVGMFAWELFGTAIEIVKRRTAALGGGEPS